MHFNRQIYLNKKNKYPKGYVIINQEPDIINKLIDIFSDLKFNGKKIIRKICQKEEIYHGPYTNNAPDLVLLPESGFCLRGGIGNKPLFEPPDIIKGMHTQQDAFLYVKGKEHQQIIPKHPTVEDIVPIMNQLHHKK